MFFSCSPKNSRGSKQENPKPAPLAENLSGPFLGVKFLVTNMLPLDTSGNRLCVAWLKSRIEFSVWKDAQFRIDPRNEYVGVREQILVQDASGATRKDKDMVFLMPCKEV
ncbi:MAG: phage capsid protein [Akkermansia sp.]